MQLVSYTGRPKPIFWVELRTSQAGAVGVSHETSPFNRDPKPTTG